jgi:hypothetical protein
LSHSKEGFEDSDLDLFIYGLDQEDADQKIYDIIQVIERNVIGNSSELTVNKLIIVQFFHENNSKSSFSFLN